jgi:DNA replication protein DnaC
VRLASSVHERRQAAVAIALVDRLVHHAEPISLKGDSYRLKDRDLGRAPAEN